MSFQNDDEQDFNFSDYNESLDAKEKELTQEELADQELQQEMSKYIDDAEIKEIIINNKHLRENIDAIAQKIIDFNEKIAQAQSNRHSRDSSLGDPDLKSKNHRLQKL